MEGFLVNNAFGMKFLLHCHSQYALNAKSTQASWKALGIHSTHATSVSNIYSKYALAKKSIAD